VNHAPPFEGVFELTENGDGIFVRLAAVDNDGAVHVTGDLQLTPEHVALHVPLGVVVKIVQPDFAHGDNLIVPGVGADFCLYVIGVTFGIVGVDPLSTVHPGRHLAEFPYPGKVVRGHRNGDHFLDINPSRLLKGFLQWAVPEVIQVTVGFDDRVIEYGNLATFFTHYRVLHSIATRVGAAIL
jgi:hypothetical protein